MLKKEQMVLVEALLEKANWELNGKNINTKGGVFIGYASDKNDAKVMAAGEEAISLIQKLQNDPNVKKLIEELLKA